MSPRHFFSRAIQKTAKKRFFVLRGLVDDVRTGFERKNDATIYIPNFQLMELV